MGAGRADAHGIRGNERAAKGALQERQRRAEQDGYRGGDCRCLYHARPDDSPA